MTTSTFPTTADNDSNLIRVISTDALIPAQHNNLVDAIEAIEANLLAGAGSTTHFYRGDNTFAVPAGGGGGGASILVNYVAATDLLSAAAITANTWTDIDANHSFTSGGSSEIYLVSVAGCVRVYAGVSAPLVKSRLVLDSGGTPSFYPLGGLDIPTSQYGNCLAGVGVVLITGLSAGAHTLKSQLYVNGAAGTAYCRCASQPTFESYSLVCLRVA